MLGADADKLDQRPLGIGLRLLELPQARIASTLADQRAKSNRGRQRWPQAATHSKRQQIAGSGYAGHGGIKPKQLYRRQHRLMEQLLT